MTGYARRQNRANPEFWSASTAIKFFLFWEIVFFSRFNPQEMNFFLFYVLSFLFYFFYTSIDYDIVLQTWLEASHLCHIHSLIVIRSEVARKSREVWARNQMINLLQPLHGNLAPRVLSYLVPLEREGAE